MRKSTLKVLLASGGCMAMLFLVKALLFGAEAKIHPPLIADVYIEGTTKWFSLTNLRAISDRHLLLTNAHLNLANLELTVNVHRNNTTNLLTFQYFEHFGLPAYSVAIDKLGQVMSVTSRIATEKRESPPKQ